MVLKRFLHVAAVVFVSDIWTSGPLFALSETRTLSGDTYQRIQHEYVNSTYILVEALCEPGDTVVKSFCYGENLWTDEHGVFLEAIDKKTETNQSGVDCKARILTPDRTLRIDSVVCKKSMI